MALDPRQLALLLVDDVEENLVALEAALQPLGHNLVKARSGEEALRFLLREDFAAVVLDVQMPGLDGFETAEVIRGRDRTSGVPIIFLTAIGREHAHHMRGFSLGAVDYLTKPVDPELLRAKVGVFVRLRLVELEVRRQARELEQRAAELARSNAELDQFASVVSHDLLDPINVIAGYVELLREQLGPELADEPAEWLGRVAQCSGRVHALVEDLLAYSRVAGETSRSGRFSLNLNDALSDAMDNLSVLLDSSAGSSVELPDRLPAARANRGEISRVFQNLIANALQHGGEAVRVAVTATEEQESVTVRVSDDGRGLPPEQMERVFGMFERARQHDPEPHSGLGLAICRRIINRSGGRIWMEPNPDGGLSVLFSLPAAPAASEVAGVVVRP